jgi:hypothetical protein
MNQFPGHIPATASPWGAGTPGAAPTAWPWTTPAAGPWVSPTGTPWTQAAPTQVGAAPLTTLPTQTPWAPTPWSMGGPSMAMQLMGLLQLLEGSMPAVEVLHSLHHQALNDPALRDLPAMQRFNQVSLHNLHAMAAAAGYIRRLLSGDLDRAVITGLIDQLRVVDRTHAETRSALTQILSAAPAKENEAARAMSQVIGLVDRANRTLDVMMKPLLAAPIPE